MAHSVYRIMKDGDYYMISRREARLHRIAAVITFLILFWVQTQGILFGSVRLIAAQIIAVGFIWFDESFYYDRLLKRQVPHRTVAWIALVGLHPMIWLCRQVFRIIFP